MSIIQEKYEALGRKLVVTNEENKASLVKAFRRYYGIKKKRKKRISRKTIIEINPELFLENHNGI